MTNGHLKVVSSLVNMAETQVDHRRIAVAKEYWIRSDDILIKVKKIKQEIHVFLFRGDKKIVIPWAVWEALLDNAETVQLARDFLNGTVGQLE